MKPIETIEEAHHILLEIAKTFHKICVNHNISYYMGYGTMLGAVRHKGFIPWDDDMDFLVFRKDINKLLRALKEELPDYYKCRTRYDNIGVYGEISKIEDTRTRIAEITNPNHSNEYGLFIDIFPLDVTKTDKKNILSRNWIISRLFQCEHNKSLKYRIARLLVGGVDTISHIVARSGNYYVEYSGMDCLKTAMPKSIYGNPTLYSFEDTTFYGVQNADAYLTHLYGDYLTMPPENERHTHIKEMWKINLI